MNCQTHTHEHFVKFIHLSLILGAKLLLIPDIKDHNPFDTYTLLLVLSF